MRNWIIYVALAFVAVAILYQENLISHKNIGFGADNTPFTQSSTPDANDEDPRSLAFADIKDETYEDNFQTEDCANDCSGHDQGWEYAKAHQISDAKSCPNKSAAFMEGCSAFASEITQRINDNSDEDNTNAQ